MNNLTEFGHDLDVECPVCAGEGGTVEYGDEYPCSACHGRGVLGGSRYDQLAAKHPELYHAEIVFMLSPPSEEETCPF